jgi:methyltransferase (TIGR00027 family)
LREAVKDAPSRTAERVALRRAAHQVLDHPKVFDDPLAVAIAGVSEFPHETLFARLLRAFMAVRSRYAEDQLTSAIARGVRQYVVLGAGLDTYAYRAAPEVRVFEVDHPATQAWKRSRLEDAGIAIPDSMRFVPVDFERQNLADELAQAGFNMDQPAFFSWLGEPFRLFFDPAELSKLLRSLGFRELEDLGPQQINARYFRDRADGLQVAGDRGHLITAWV